MKKICGCTVAKDVFQQNRVPPIKLRCKQAESRNDRQLAGIGDRYQKRFGGGIRSGDSGFITRVDFNNACLFVNDFRLIVPKSGNFMGNFVMRRLTDNNAHEFCASSGNPTRRKNLTGTATVGEGIERPLSNLWRWRSVFCNSGQRASDWNFMNRVFRQRYTNRIPDAVGKQTPNANRALDATIFTIARFRYTQVDRVIPSLRRTILLSSRQDFRCIQLIETRNKQAVGLNHDLWIRRLHRKDKVLIIHFASELGKFQRAFNHSQRRVAVAVHDAVAQASMICSNPHRNAAFSAKSDQWSELLADAANLRLVFLIRVFTDLKFFGVGKVARVDAHLVNPASGFHGGFWLEMDIGDKRHGATCFQQCGANMLEIPRVFDSRSGNPHDLTTNLHQP